MAVSRAQSETGSVVNTKFGARPIIDLPAFAYGVGKNNYMSSNLADVPPRMFGPTEYSYNVGKNVPRDHSNGGYVGQYYNQSPRGYQNSPTSNLVNESNVLPYPSYTTVPNMAAQQLPMPPQGPNMAAQQPPMPPQGQMAQPYGGQGNETHLYYGPNGERLPGPPSEMFRPRPQYTTNRRQYPTNFKIEGTLEYGKMVSIRIKEGNVSFRDIPDSVLANCHKTYRMIPRTEVTIEAENGEYNVYASPDVPSPMLRHQGYMYDPNKSYSNARRATVYPRSFSLNRQAPHHDIYTKKYEVDYYADDSYQRRHTSYETYPRDPREMHREPRDIRREPREIQRKHWYSSGANVERDDRRVHEMERTGLRDPQRKPLPMKQMNPRKHERTA